MNNGQRRNTAEKKEFRFYAINSGLNPYNLKAPNRGKATGRMIVKKQYIRIKGTKSIRVINHY